MNDLIREARELSSEASDGPWEHFDTPDYTEIHVPNGRENRYPPVAISNATYNAAFIARSRTLVPELADALERAEITIQDERKEHAAEFERMKSTYIREGRKLTVRAEKAEAELAAYKAAMQNWHEDDEADRPH